MADYLDELQKLLDQDADEATIKAALDQLADDADPRKKIVSKEYYSEQIYDAKCESKLRQRNVLKITYDDGSVAYRYGSSHCV